MLPLSIKRPSSISVGVANYRTLIVLLLIDTTTTEDLWPTSFVAYKLISSLEVFNIQMLKLQAGLNQGLGSSG